MHGLSIPCQTKTARVCMLEKAIGPGYTDICVTINSLHYYNANFKGYILRVTFSNKYAYSK